MSRTKRYLDEETGVALVFALLAVIVLGGLAVLFVNRAVAESRLTHSEQRFETTIHLAEAAIDDLIFELNTDFSVVTADPAGPVHTYSLSPSASRDEQRAWAIDKAEDECDLVETDVDLGEACAIRPVLPSGQAAPFIFGVGFLPDAASQDKVRVVKVGIRLGEFVPAQSILTNGDLNPLNITICGVDRDVHSNTTMTVQGSADTVTPGTKSDSCPETASGKVTSKGAFTVSGNPDIDPASGQNGKEVFVPSVSAIEMYEEALRTTRSDGSANPDYERNRQNWYTLCPNGDVRGPNIDPTSNEPVREPCGAGAPLIPYTGAFKGWKPPNGATSPWSAGGGGNAPPLSDGVFYVYERNAEISGNIGGNIQISLIVDAVGTIEPFERHENPSDFAADRTCAKNGKNDGNISIQGVGGGDIEPFMPHNLFIADRDVSMGGNVSSDVRGVIAAHEQTGLGGTPNIIGAVIAEDACRHSSQSPESKNYVSGSFSLDHSFPLDTMLPSVVHITAWNEY